MSQGFTAVNLPLEDEAPMGSQAIVLYKDEDMEDNVGDADATEVSSLTALSSRNGLNSMNIISFHISCFSDLTA